MTSESFERRLPNSQCSIARLIKLSLPGYFRNYISDCAVLKAIPWWARMLLPAEYLETLVEKASSEYLEFEPAGLGDWEAVKRGLGTAFMVMAKPNRMS